MAAGAALIVAALLVAACTGDQDASPAAGPAITDASPGSEPPFTWTACGDPLECTTFPVPLDWDDPDGATIELAVIRHPASDPDGRIGTIFANPGGPGESGVGFVRGAGDDLDAWGDGRFDWISWDPRGTHASTPVECFTSDAAEDEFWDGVGIPSSPTESEVQAARTEDLAQRCGEVMGPVLSHVSTTDTVRDMEAMRAALGEETLTYVGLSYGSFVGQVYANLYPERVRAMLLDGIVDPVAYTAGAEERVATGVAPTDEVFEQFLSTCEAAGAERCALAGHGEAAALRVARLFEAVSREPIPAPNATPAGDLDQGDLLLAGFAPLRDPALWPRYAEELDAAVEGDASALLDAARLLRTPSAWAEATTSAAIACLDGPAVGTGAEWPTVIADLTEVSSLAGAVQGWWLWAPCASSWPARSDSRFRGPWDTPTAVPILLIGTRHDPNAGYENAVRSEQLLGNAVLLTHDGYGHLSFQDRSECVEAARVRYLVELETPPPGTVCPADQEPFSQGS